MTTIKEIAKICNVSIATVSNILNGKPGASQETREYVLKVAKELNYTPNVVAQNLKLRNTKSIGVIAEDMTIFSMPDIIDGITEHCEEHGYQILLINLRLYKKYNDTYYNDTFYYKNVEAELRKLMSKQVEGIIYIGAHERVIKCIPDNITIPVVMAYGYTENVEIPSVVVDDEYGAYQVMKYLIDKGHKNIGVITGKKDSMHMQARLNGYQKALYDHRLLYNPDIVLTGDWNRESGYFLADSLVKNHVTAIFCMNDVMAGGAYDRLTELGKRVGTDIALVGYDDQKISSYYNPPLTTVTLPLHDIGYKSSEILVGMLNKEKSDSETGVYRVRGRLVLRKSVNLISE